jgi:hypothetical protein
MKAAWRSMSMRRECARVRTNTINANTTAKLAMVRESQIFHRGSGDTRAMEILTSLTLRGLVVAGCLGSHTSQITMTN